MEASERATFFQLKVSKGGPFVPKWHTKGKWLDLRGGASPHITL